MNHPQRSPDFTRILTINCGSATLKAALYDIHRREEPRLSIKVERLDTPHSRMRISDSIGESLFDEAIPQHNSEGALAAIFQWLGDGGYLSQLSGVGHRLVHGGPRFSEPQRVTARLLEQLEQFVALDPDHLPEAMSVIRFVARKFPDLPQVACFDTAFHAGLPKVARMYALPRRFADSECGILRYGFHGLSYEYILHKLRALDGVLADRRVIVAHLGSGSSMVALHGGKSVDTSMGFTPLEGLVMGTRPGDVDPGALLYLLKQKNLSPQELGAILNKQSGLLGISGSSADMRDLLEEAPGDSRASEAIDLFCYRVKKYIGAYAAALGGLDLLVFTGGIGERASAIRQKICTGLEFLGIQLDSSKNQANAELISNPQSLVKVRAIETNEDLMIARHVLAVLGSARPKGS